MHATTHKVLNERQTVYRLTPPAWIYDERHEFVVASLSNAWGTGSGSFFGGYPTECLVFPSNGEGISDFGEIGGSYECPGGHAEALRGLGYTIDG